MKGQVKDTSQVCDFGSHFLPKSEEVQGWTDQNMGCEPNSVRHCWDIQFELFD